MSNKPTIEHVRSDIQREFNEQFAKSAKQARQQSPADVAAKLARNAVGAVIYFAIESVPSREGEPNRVRARAVSGLPHTDQSLVAYGTSTDEALFEARHQLIELYHSCKSNGETWADCRAKATSAKFELFSIDLT